MDDVNQSTSENNIIVDGIEDFSDSPHEKKLTASEWEKEHKAGMHLDWVSTCTNFLRVNSLWRLNSSHQLWTR